jgi:hypothetical protein
MVRITYKILFDAPWLSSVGHKPLRSPTAPGRTVILTLINYIKKDESWLEKGLLAEFDKHIHDRTPDSFRKSAYVSQSQ